MEYYLYITQGNRLVVWQKYPTIDEAKTAGRWIIDSRMSERIHIQFGGRTIYYCAS